VIEGMDLVQMLRLINDFGLLLPADVAVYILESLLLALHHAHHLQINDEEVCVIHRDISPHNLLVSRAGVVKLADFGIAKAKGISPDTPSGVLKGKLTYLAPERIRNGSRPLGPESDLFSAGIIFWEMLAKERLFKATMEHEVLARVMNFDKAPIEHLHPRMNRFLEKILAPKPQDRFQSAEEALYDLKKIGIRPCSQGDMSRVVTKLKAFKDLAVAYQQLKEETYSPSTMSIQQTAPLGGGTRPVESKQQESSDAVDAMHAESDSKRRRHIRIAVYAAMAVALSATAIVAMWRLGVRQNEVATDTDAVQTVSEQKQADNTLNEKPGSSAIIVLKAAIDTSLDSQDVIPPADKKISKCPGGSASCLGDGVVDKRRRNKPGVKKNGKESDSLRTGGLQPFEIDNEQDNEN
jgi:serine/threonine protein kinase